MSACPFCHVEQERLAVFNAAAGRLPELGCNASICWSCRKVSVIEVGPLGTIRRKPTREEQAHIDARPEIKLALAAMTEADGPSAAIELARRNLVDRS
jgi:hypothetical protein